MILLLIKDIASQNEFYYNLTQRNTGFKPVLQTDPDKIVS
ncbi:hypothetical protein ES703_69468 [subsurface metagenome]